MEPVTEFDISAELDEQWQIIADEFGVNEKTARRIEAWADKRALSGREETSANAQLLHRFVCWLLAGGDVRLKTVAMVFAAGLNNLHGWNSMSHAAEELNCSRQAIDKLVLEIQAWLALPANEWNRSSYARDSYAQSRQVFLSPESLALKFRRWRTRVSPERWNVSELGIVIQTLSEIVSFSDFLKQKKTEKQSECQ